MLSTGELSSPTETVRDVRPVGDPPIEALMSMDEAFFALFDFSLSFSGSSGSWIGHMTKKKFTAASNGE